MTRILLALAILVSLAPLARVQDMPFSQILIDGEGWKEGDGTWRIKPTKDGCQKLHTGAFRDVVVKRDQKYVLELNESGEAPITDAFISRDDGTVYIGRRSAGDVSQAQYDGSSALKAHPFQLPQGQVQSRIGSSTCITSASND